MEQSRAKPFMASHYKLATFQKCPRLYYFEYLDDELAPIKKQIKKPRPELEVGNVVHLTLFNYFREPAQYRSFTTLRRILESLWRPPRATVYGFTSIDQERAWYRDALVMLKNFYEHQNSTEHLFYVPDPLSREELIKIPITDDIIPQVKSVPTIILQGKIDRIDEDGDDLNIIDYKTGKSQNDDESQVMTYVLLAKQKFGREVKKASYFYLRTSFMKTFTPSGGAQQVALEKIKRAIASIKAETEYAPKPSKLCKYCDFLDYCPAKKEILELLNRTTQAGEKEPAFL